MRLGNDRLAKDKDTQNREDFNAREFPKCARIFVFKGNIESVMRIALWELMGTRSFLSARSVKACQLETHQPCITAYVSADEDCDRMCAVDNMRV